MSGVLNLALSWSAPGGTCQTEDYGIYSGSLPFLSYDHEIIACSTGGLTNAIITMNNDSYYYIGVAQNQSYEGSYRVDLSKNQRPAANSSCYPQLISQCDNMHNGKTLNIMQLIRQKH